MIALVSGGSRPMFAENNVMIYDDKKNKFVLEFTLPSPVLGVRLKRNKLVAICRSLKHLCYLVKTLKRLLFHVTQLGKRGT